MWFLFKPQSDYKEKKKGTKKGEGMINKGDRGTNPASLRRGWFMETETKANQQVLRLQVYRDHGVGKRRIFEPPGTPRNAF